MARKEFKSKKQSQKRSLTAHFDPKSPIAERYRTIRTNIQYAAAVDGEARSIMITSPNPSEGKSTTAANLAVVMAQQGKKVLLVDADLRKPTMHYTFQLANVIGLTSILTKQSKLTEAVNGSEVPNLSIITSGPIPPNPAELLGSKALTGFIKEVLEDFDLVIFDSPPVMAVTDAQVLANYCEGVILVINSGKTETETAVKAKELLLPAKAKLLGVVLNGKKIRNSAYYYYYGKI